MEQLKKNRIRTFYRNYVNEKLIGSKNNKKLKKLEKFVSMEVIEKETIEKILIKFNIFHYFRKIVYNCLKI